MQFSYAQQQNGISTKKVDSLLINTGKKFLVKAEIKSKDFSKQKDCEVCMPSVFSLVIKDYNNSILLNHTSKAIDDGNSEIPTSMYLKGIGNVLAIQSSSSPSVASEQGNIILYNVNKEGKLQAVTTEIPITGNFDDGSFFRVNKFADPYCPTDSFASEKHFCLETINFISYCGFNIGKFYKLDLDGFMRSAMIEKDTIPVYIEKGDSKRYIKLSANIIELLKIGQTAKEKTITLYAAPKINAETQKISLQKNMPLQFNFILHKNHPSAISENDFIQVVINGQIGYLKGYDELPKLGFPNCD
jgi:hypothetical protein